MNDCAILITGAARRIGRAMALSFAGRGYDIALHYRSSETDAQQTKAEIEALGRRAVLLNADLLEADAAELIARAKNALPGLNGLILNASIFEPATLAESNQDDFDRHMNLHLRSSYFLAQAYAQQVGQGHILALLDSSITGLAHTYFPYLLSKKALAALVPMLAKELAPAIRVNAIAPGMTPFSDDIPPEEQEKRRAALPLKALASPAQIAHAAAFLFEADYLTGQTLFVDGGQHLR